MKKSEKVEVRMSLDEKERLNALAENEGRSVSELVRDVVGRYASLNIATPHKPVWPKAMMAGFLMSGIGIGFGSSFLTKHFIPETTSYYAQGSIGNNAFGKAVFSDAAQTVQFEEFSILFEPTEMPNGASGFRVSLCENGKSDCALMNAKIVPLPTSGPSVLQDVTINNDAVFVTISQS